MIDPSNITNFDRTLPELEEYFLFCACVAGKTATIQAQKLDNFLMPARNKNMTPFEYIQFLIDNNILREMVCDAKLGQYNRLTKIFEEAVKIDPLNVTIRELELIPGIGPKTSRFYLLHSRPNQNFAVLDTHILAWLRDNIEGVTIPTATPQSPTRYRILEEVFLREAKKRNILPEDLDLQIWNERSRKIYSLTPSL